MAKDSSDKSVWKIFFEGLKIYCFNFPKFFLYMAYPVLGQLLGLSLVFGLTFWYTNNLPDLIQKYSVFNNFSTIVFTVILITVPGLLIWAKAFWNYLVAYVALNSMTEAAITTGKVYDFKAHNAVVTQRTFSYIVLWLLFSIFTLIAIIPFFWILGFIFFVYFVLIFQVFTFEKNVSPLECFKRSLQLIKGKFGRTMLLLFILTLLTYNLLSMGVTVLFDALKFTDLLAEIFEGWASTLPLEQINAFLASFNTSLTPIMIAREFVGQIILFIVIGFTLPLRSICWTLWYKNLYSGIVDVKPKTKKTSKKESSKKVKNYEKSDKKQFKIEKRGIDPEIIRRARLEDDEY